MEIHMPNDYIIQIGEYQECPVGILKKGSWMRVLALKDSSCLELDKDKWVEANYSDIDQFDLENWQYFLNISIHGSTEIDLSVKARQRALNTFICGLNKPQTEAEPPVINHPAMSEIIMQIIEDALNKSYTSWFPQGNHISFDGFVLRIDDQEYELPIGENYFADIGFDMKEFFIKSINNRRELERMLAV